MVNFKFNLLVVVFFKFFFFNADPLTSQQRRNLVLICKVLQNLSNDILFGKKEPFMIPLNDFLTSKRPIMLSLLDKLAVSFLFFIFLNSSDSKFI